MFRINLVLLISSLFILGLTGECFSQTPVPAPVGLVSWWPGDGNALDSRSHNDGLLQNGATFSPGRVGQGFSFDGVNDFLEVADNSSLNFGTGDFSVEFWININGAQISANREYGIINKNANYQDTPGWGFELSTEFGNFPNPRIDFYETRTGWNFTNVRSPITVNTWHHVVAMRQGGDTNKLYIDGVLVASRTEGFFIAGNISNSQPLMIGAWLGSFSPGQLDEISIYNRGLSANEVQTLYAAGTAGKCKPTATVTPDGLIGWWPGDGTADDFSGNSNNGILINNAGFAVGKSGQSLAFDGVSQFVSVADSPSLEVGAQLTVEAWIFPSDTSRFRQIVSKFGAEGNWAFQIGQAPNGALRTDLSETGGSPYSQLTSPPNVVTANVWNHIAVTFNAGATTLYANGTPVASANLPLSSIFSGGNTGVNIGRDPIGSQHFAGLIDESSIYNRALSQSEITSIFNSGQAGKLKTVNTPLGLADLGSWRGDFGFENNKPTSEIRIPQSVVTTVGDVTLTFQNVSVAGTTQQIPLDASLLPALPNGATSVGLTYDVATSAVFTGNVDLCFNLAALASPNFGNLRVYHLESGVWVNRTAPVNASPNLCTTGVTSLSPFAIGSFVPTAANVSVGGRIATLRGSGISRVSVSIHNVRTGEIRNVMTNTFGNFRIDDLTSGDFYILSVRKKGYQFNPNQQGFQLNDNLDDLSITGSPDN